MQQLKYDIIDTPFLVNPCMGISFTISISWCVPVQKNRHYLTFKSSPFAPIIIEIQASALLLYLENFSYHEMIRYVALYISLMVQVQQIYTHSKHFFITHQPHTVHNNLIFCCKSMRIEHED